MGAKIKHIGINVMVETSSVKMCDFFNRFRVYKRSDFALKKTCSCCLHPVLQNLDPTKTAFSEFFFPKNAIDVSVTSPCVQKMTQITETKKQFDRTF